MQNENTQNENKRKKLFKYIYGKNVEDKYPNIEISIELITPEIAEEMLKTNVKNRSMKRVPLNKALKNGEWILNGETIVFDELGRLSDGQHRLAEVVNTGIPIVTIVVRGVDKNAQITMDTGAKRILADYLVMDGYKDASKVAAMAVALMKVDNDGFDTHYLKGGREDSSTLLEKYEYTKSIYDQRIEPIRRQTVATANCFGIGTGLIAPLYDAFNRVNTADFEEFSNQLRGISSQCQPVQLLYRKLSENKVSKKEKLTNKTIAAFFIKAWNAYMQGEELAFLRFSAGGHHPENFPSIYGLD